MRSRDTHRHSSSQRLRLWSAAVLLCSAALLLPSRAEALQPLSEFLRGAEERSPAGAEARATLQQREAEEMAVTSRLLPSLSIWGTYSHNQYQREFVFPGSTEPQAFLQMNQLDAAIVLTVPLVNVAVWKERATSQALLDLARANEAAVQQDVDRQVVLAYYRLLGSAAVRQAAERNLTIARDNAQLVAERRAAGMTTELDVKRSQADVSRAEQDVESARLAEQIATRSLATLSGVPPQRVESFPEDDLRPEAPLARFTKSAETAPAMTAAKAATEAAQQQADGSTSTWYPTLTGTAQERFTNATALVGHEAYYSLQLTAAWNFDFGKLYTPTAQRASATAAQARETQRQDQVDDAVFAAWSQVRSGIKKARSARAQADAADAALELARQQYEVGVITQIEVLAAQQAAFAGDVARIQTDTDLAYARAYLRILSGTKLGEH